MSFQLGYTSNLTVDRNFLRIPAIFNNSQIIIESDDYLRLNQELVIPEVGDVYIPESRLIPNGKSLLRLDNQYPYRLLVRSRDNRTQSQVEVTVWFNPVEPASGNGSSATSPITQTSTSFINASVVSASLLSPNSNRVGAIFHNRSTATLYLDYDDSASSSVFSTPLYPGSWHSLPYSFAGEVAGAWSSENGGVFIREFFKS